MGVLIVNCPNRPKDEMIDCGVYGIFMNMHSHNVDVIDDEVLIGFPLEKGRKLPTYSSTEGDAEKIEALRAQAVGAVLGTKTSGILSTDPPGGALIEPEPAPKPKVSEPKPAQPGGGE